MTMFFLICLMQTNIPCSDSQLITAVAQHESNDNSRAVAKGCNGCLQIRQECLDDVNRCYGTHYKVADVIGNRELSFRIFTLYVDIYATEDNLGHPPTQRDRVRIWNGGPTGHLKKCTLPYWHAVKRRLMSPAQ